MLHAGFREFDEAAIRAAGKILLGNLLISAQTSKPGSLVAGCSQG
jgi:hypothetical protein